MSIRKPIKIATFLDTGDVGGSSVAGIVPFTVNLPQDTDNVIVKLTSSVSGGTVSATFQTTDDGGTTWYDVARTPTVGLANNTIANFLSIPVISMGIRSTSTGAASTTSGTTQMSVLSATGPAASSSLGVGQVSGLPIMDTFARIALIYTGNVTVNNLTRVDVYANNQSNRA